jgi:hypothetical protein
MKTRSGRLWKQGLSGESSEYGTDDRRDGWGYDAAGNLTESDSTVNSFDAAGSQTYSHPPTAGECGGYDYEIVQAYDGAGRPAKRVQTTRRDVSTDPAQVQCETTAQETYYVYSAALGGAKLLELDTNGAKVKGYVYGGGMLLAKQEIYPSLGSSGVKWQHMNPGSTSWVETASNRVYERQEMDPLGQEVGTADPFLIVPNPNYSDVHGDTPMFVDGGDPFHLSDGCGDIDGMPASCAEISDRVRNGSAEHSTFGTITTVTIRDGKGMRSYQGFAGLPPGEFRFTGAGARLATSSFDWDKDEEFGTRVFTAMVWGRIGSGTRVEDNANHFAPQNADGRGELTGRRLQEYTTARDRVLDRLANSESCQRFLLENFGLSSGAVAKAVRNQRAFDGTTSTITAADAGLVPRIDPLNNKPHTEANKQVKDLFYIQAGGYMADAIQAGFASKDDKGATQRDVYYGFAFTAATVLHETLHSFTGLNDEQIAVKLGTKTNLSTLLSNAGCE